MSIAGWQKTVHDLAVSKGWWDGVKPGDDSSVPEKLCLIHSEISEALECYRNREPYEHTHKSKPEGLGVELADAVIRIMDLCGHLGIDLEGCIRRKHEYNKGRETRHGGKRC